MKQKVESGEAKTYGEAEKLVETERVLSVGDIKKYAEDLKAKVEAARLQKEKDVEQKLTDHEALIGEKKTNGELLQTAQETLEYFASMRELGELKDPADVKKLEEIESLVASLEKQRLEIDKKIGVIVGRPEILEKLYDAAKKEDVERTVNKEVEKAHEQFNPQIDQLGQSIGSLAKRRDFLWRQKERQEKDVSAAWGEISSSFARAKGMLGAKSRFGYTLDEILRQASTPEEIQQRLSAAKKELGMFKGKEKAAIDFVLAQTRKFEEYNRARAGSSALEQQLEAGKIEETVLMGQYKAIILGSWEAQSKINELTGRPSASDLPSELSFRLEGIMKKMADVKRWEGDKQVGKFDGWYKANQDPKNRALSGVYGDVVEKAGGLQLIYYNPKETKERE